MRGEKRERDLIPGNHAEFEIDLIYMYPFPGNTDPLRKLIRRDILEKNAWI